MRKINSGAGTIQNYNAYIGAWNHGPFTPSSDLLANGATFDSNTRQFLTVATTGGAASARTSRPAGSS